MKTKIYQYLYTFIIVFIFILSNKYIQRITCSNVLSAQTISTEIDSNYAKNETQDYNKQISNHENKIISVILNIVGGIIVAILVPVWTKIKRYLRQFTIKKLLGNDADASSNFYVVYAKLSLPEFYDRTTDKILTHPYYKEVIEGHRPKSKFSITYPVSSCENRAVSYISSFYAYNIKKDIQIVSDIDIFKDVDISYISLGWDSNYKTLDAIKNESNKMIYIGYDHNFRSVETKKKIYTKEPNYDYGLILKIHPYEFPKRVWMLCAGIGEYGTSGAAWFLSHKWKELFRKSNIIENPLSRFKSSNFAAIIRVDPGKDESAVIVKLIIDKQINIENYHLGTVKPIRYKSDYVQPSPSGTPFGYVREDNDGTLDTLESSGTTSNPTSSSDYSKDSKF